MNTVNIEAIKLAIIETVLRIKEISALEHFEDLATLLNGKKEDNKQGGVWLDGTPINKETIQLRINQTEIDRKNGALLTQEELEKEAEKW